MIEATLALAIEPLAHYFATGAEQPFYLRGAYSQAYILTCKDGKRIALQMSSREKFWRGLAAAIEQPDLLERYPGSQEPRRQLRKDRRRAVRDLRATAALRVAGDGCSSTTCRSLPSIELSELGHDPQVRHLDPFYTLDHPTAGAVKSVHRAIRIDGSRDIDFRPPPMLGEHTV